MTARHDGPKISDELPPGRRKLAQIVEALYQHLGTPTLREAVRLLGEHGYSKYASEISRYRRGLVVPEVGFVRTLYKAAVEQAGGEPAVGMSLDDVLEVHAAAEPRLCNSCHTLHQKIRGLRSRNRRLLRDNRRLSRPKAGLEEELTDTCKQVTPLPVPSQEGDRQQRAYDVDAARQVASMAASLNEETDPDAALAVLQTSEVLTPLESAASLVLLRKQHRDRLADTLITIYGRDHPKRDVIRAALQLHEYGMADDAGAMLRAAAG